MKSSYVNILFGLILSAVFVLPAKGQVDSTELERLNNLEQPDMEKWGATPEDSLECVKNFSLYQEYYQNFKTTKEAGRLDEAKDYMESVIDPWRYVFNNCPVASQNTYRDGARIIKYLYNNADDDHKPAYADTLMMVYDQRLDMFGWKEGAGYILGLKAVDHMQYKRGETEKSFEMFETSYELIKPENYNAAVLYYHLYAAVNMFRMGKAEESLIVETYDKVSTVFEDKIEAKADNYQSFKQLYPRVEQMFDPFAKCEDLIRIYGKKLEDNPNDEKLLKRISSMLDDKGCTDSDLYFTATKRVHSLSPSAESAFLMGKMSIQRELFDEASDYLQEAATTFEDSTRINEAYYMLANVNNAQGKRSSARSNALKALNYKPDDGRCYILIGDLYANSASVCESDSKVASKSIYWAAVDKYQKAKSVDPEVADKAQSKINRYRQYFPSQEELFFENFDEGDSYTVGCWINENTKVRKR
ncbi:MAG: hypothetical protein R6T91_01635 [Bacteroidales bacterium]